MLTDIVSPDKILLHQSVSDWQQAITVAAKPLLDSKYIYPEYITAMIDAVKNYGPYIVIAKGVALAHARSEDGVKSMGLSIMTTKDPINFGNPKNDPVKIIFCLAAPDPTTHLDVMRSLVNVINENWKIEQLSKIDNIEQFISILNKFEQNA